MDERSAIYSMNMKKLKQSVITTSVIIGLCVLFNGVLIVNEPETASVSMQTDAVGECNENDCIEAYQTENSTVIEAYLQEVHYIDQR